MADNFSYELKRSVSEIRTRHPGLQADQAFIYWFMQAFITEDMGAAIGALVGGANDKNIDAIYILQGSRQKFNTIVRNAEAGMVPLLKQARSVLKQKQYQLALQYVTTARVSAQHVEEAEEHAIEHGSTTLQVFDNKSLRRLMQDYIDGAAPPIPTVNLKIEGNEAFVSSDGKTDVTSWVFSMNGKDLGDLFTRHGVRIFARNIRGFLGKKTSVNKAMDNTIESNPELFWYYNNGATIICDSAKQVIESDRTYLKVANAQVINGQQTTRTLAEYNGSEKVKVLVRVNVVPRSKECDFSHYNQLVSEIVKATNSQNEIKPSDLISNDAEQIRIEREMRKLGYFYARKAMTKGEMRAHYGARNRQIIKRDDLVMALASCTVDPSVVRRGKQQFFVAPYYKGLFDGRSIYKYLSIYWVYMFGKYVYKGRGPEIGYSRHIVNYQLWKDIGASLSKKDRAEKFLFLASSRRYDELDMFYTMIEIMMREAMHCYRNNNRYQGVGKNGKPKNMRYAEIDYFKRASTLNEWLRHWKTGASNQSHDRYKKSQQKLFNHLDSFELV
jgi:hypothetical protein